MVKIMTAMPRKLVEEAAEAGWVTYIIGVGTEAGATIPIAIDGQKYVKLDEAGQACPNCPQQTPDVGTGSKGKRQIF